MLIKKRVYDFIEQVINNPDDGSNIEAVIIMLERNSNQDFRINNNYANTLASEKKGTLNIFVRKDCGLKFANWT